MTTLCDTNCDLPICVGCPAAKPETKPADTRCACDSTPEAWGANGECGALETAYDVLAECSEVIAGRRPDKDIDDLLSRSNALTGCDIRRKW